MKRLLVALLSLSACGPAGPPFSMGRPPAQKPPANAVGGFSIDVPPVALQPGDEQLPCFIFPLDLTGPSHMVGGGVLTVGPGMHHGNVTTRKKTGDGVRACQPQDVGGQNEAIDIINGGAVLFGSSTQVTGSEWQSFPAGMAYRIKDGYEIVARMHYLNATPNALTVAPRYQWFTVDEKAVTHELAPFAWDYQRFSIPPRQTVTVTAQCSFMDPMNVVMVLPHMHKLGTSFTAGFLGGKLDGKLWLDSRGYDPENGVMQTFDPPINLGQGDGSTFSCTWKNTFDKTIVEGIGDNEMCILFGYAYPPAATYSAAASQGSCVGVTPN